jgi:hypothetical protein
VNTPNDCSDDTINRLWEGGPVLPRDIPPAALNPETMLSYVIDLRRKYIFQFERLGLDRLPEYRCIDVLTFDPDPDSTWHIIGKGSTRGDAQAHLLEQLAYAVAHE